MTAKNPLVQAHNSAIRMNDTIGKLFAETGSVAHPRGYITTSYRMAHRALRSALTENDPRAAARDILAGLKQSIRSASIPYFLDAQTLGVEESIKQLKLYGIDGGQPMHFQHDYEAVNAAADVISAKIEEQEKLVDLCLLTGATDEQILGDDVRAGALRASDVAVTAATWAAVLLWDAFSRWTTYRTPTGTSYTFQKQAIAALDARTTDCCIRAHGQIQPMDRPFHLTGTPRFAEYVDWTPFHWRCRTSIALYLPAYDMGSTEAMQSSARLIMAERAAGGTGDRDPANAYA